MLSSHIFSFLGLKECLYEGHSLHHSTELYREKPCLPARNKEALLMNCCSMIPIPLSLAVNDDINCYCYIMLTFRVLQNWHNVRNGRIKHREANE